MLEYAEVELGLHSWEQPGAYEVDFRFNQSGTEAEVRPPLLNPVTLDLQQLNALADDSVAYGKYLTAQIFSSDTERELEKARSAAASRSIPLRLRLLVSPSAAALHAVRWETLRDPQHEDDASLVTDQNVLFSRYVQSGEWRPVRPRPAEALKALVVIANPRNLASLKVAPPLAAANVEEERQRVGSALSRCTVAELPSGGTATLDNIVAKLRDGVDILYIVCHGQLVRGETRLVLEDEQGDADLVSGRELVAEIRQLESQPRLIVLTACHSGEGALTADGQYLAALGPQLAEAGVPAVVAMQGSVTVRSAASFLDAFFAKLDETGEVDRAMAEGRWSIRSNPDAWMPVLYTRLKTGRIWFDESLHTTGRSSREGWWSALLNNIAQERCTPILGPGIYESLLGPFRSLARRWSDTYRYPFAFQGQGDLPQIAQYLLVSNAGDFNYPRDELKAYFRREVSRRFGQELTGDVAKEDLETLIDDAWQKNARKDDPHRILAALPCPLYVTAMYGTVLERALREGGKSPLTAVCPWNDATEAVPIPSKLDAQSPVVYHLFGRLASNDSIVLTEDDYFDYLIGTTLNKDMIPASVRVRFANSALLFLGFQMSDWNFRVLFRSIMQKSGSFLRGRYAHVAVQMEPDAAGMQEPDLVYRYFEDYFREARISIFWGSVEEFTSELQRHWRETYGSELAKAS